MLAIVLLLLTALATWPAHAIVRVDGPAVTLRDEFTWRGYREFTQNIPQPGWDEHDHEQILRVSLEAVAHSLASAG